MAVADMDYSSLQAALQSEMVGMVCRDVVSVSKSRSRDVFLVRLGLEKIWEDLGLVSNRKPNISVSDHNISFYKLIFGCSSLKLVISVGCRRS